MTEKYLALLRFILTEHPEAREKVLLVEGRRRKYFAKSASEIERSGASTHPRKIPGTELWALTNMDTAHKRELLARVLRMLAYPEDEVTLAVGAMV